MPDEGTLASLSLGGNQGDVREAFRHALQRLATTPGVSVLKRSTVWRTPPWGVTTQPDFLNMAALVQTTLLPRALLDLCLAIELERGRERRERWGQRTLDIDVITYGDVTIDEAGLLVPHPRAAERAFVLAPLAEIVPDSKIGGSRVTDLLARLDIGEARSIGSL